jgi:hypothetical protein
LFANAAYHYLHIMHRIAFGKLYAGYICLFQANCIAAFLAFEMHVMIVMMMFRTFGFAQGIPYGSICSRYFVDDALVEERLQGTVDSDPVKSLSEFFLKVTVFQGSVTLHEELQYFHAGLSNTQVTVPQ